VAESPNNRRPVADIVGRLVDLEMRDAELRSMLTDHAAERVKLLAALGRINLAAELSQAGR
jgi:hypothetical protein